MRATLFLCTLLSIISDASAVVPCCRDACASGYLKFWRILKVNETMRCEEICMGYKEEMALNLYERDLVAANNTTNPCAEQGYSIYETTVDHGVYPMSFSADSYAQAPPTRSHEFIRGVAEALGYDGFKGCFADGHQIVTDLDQARQLYKQGGYLDKAKALEELGAAAKEVMTTLDQCSTAIANVETYATLAKNLKDHRFYTLHNALTLALNIAEDRNMIASLIEDLDSKRDYEAGKLLVVTVLDILERPGIPDSNSSAAVQVAAGIADGFVGHIDIKCFSEAHVEIKSLVGGLMQLLTHLSPSGLESVFHGIKNLPTTYKRCLADEPAIANLLKVCTDFKHPKELADLLFHNLESHATDVVIEVGKAVLAFQGQEWRHLGKAVGTILNKIAMSTADVIV